MIKLIFILVILLIVLLVVFMFCALRLGKESDNERKNVKH